MPKNKIKPTSVRIPEELLDNIDMICNDSGCSRNEYITSVLDDAIHNESDKEDISKPTLTKIIQGEVIDPVKLSCKNGELWTHWNEDRIRTKYGDCANFELTNGKVYNDSGELVGIIENQD